MAKLTDVEVKRAKPSAQIVKLSDGGGLQLWVYPDGAKRWRLAYRYDGKQKSLALGVYNAIGLADARAAAKATTDLLAKGTDPGQQRKIDRLTKAESNAITFRKVAEELIAKAAKEGKAASTLSKLEWHLLTLACPDLGERPISDIGSREILAVLKKVEETGRYETATRMRALIGRVFRYAIATDRADKDPTAALKGALVTPKVKHHAAILEPVAVGGLLRAVWAYAGMPETRIALQLMAYLHPRPGELRGARWEEIDLPNAIWTIPASRTKTRSEHRAPLPTQAIAILRELQELTGSHDLLFPGVRTPRKPMSENTMNSALRLMGFDKDTMSAHGFRAIFSTLANESGRWTVDAIERALAHKDPDEVRRAYARGAHWAERTEMAQWWADHIDTLREGGKVVPFGIARTL